MTAGCQCAAVGGFSEPFVSTAWPKGPQHVDQALFQRSPDMSRVECIQIQGLRAADAAGYLSALITQKMGALGSPEG
ncbi:hypothetical protein DSLASN_37310 [Desulfoluna limicola]|uniref:Uncharacterized protein n=1 Tax=Desulfoluna limicola TaxID=2810562 RepID=A0ABN6F7E8_9BACT|nr:hypothetical protein DSLASN_37310 [Desulfoluna limicola]